MQIYNNNSNPFHIMGLVLIASTKQQYDLCSTYIAMITFVIGQLVPKSIITICCCMIDIYLYVSAFPSISSLHKVIKNTVTWVTTLCLLKPAMGMAYTVNLTTPVHACQCAHILLYSMRLLLLTI